MNNNSRINSRNTINRSLNMKSNIIKAKTGIDINNVHNMNLNTDYMYEQVDKLFKHIDSFLDIVDKRVSSLQTDIKKIMSYLADYS